MIALSGAYNTESHGYQSVGINPANLAFNQSTSFNFFNMNLNLQNNFLTNDRNEVFKAQFSKFCA